MISKYEAKDFVTISNGHITWQGYFYNEGEGGRLVQYSSFSMTIHEFITDYHNDSDLAYNEFGELSPQYITDYDDDNAWEKDFKEWLEGTTPINPKDISEDTPDGDYVLMEA